MRFAGRVHTILFDNPGRAFYILRMTLDEEDTAPKAEVKVGTLDTFSFNAPLVVVKGHIPGISIQIGTWFAFEAEWTRHKEFGKQLTITRAPLIESTWTVESALRVLGSNGVSRVIGQQILDHFGDRFLDVLDKVSDLAQVPGLDQVTALFVQQRWLKIQAYYKGLNFLLNLNLPGNLVQQVWSVFGDDVVPLLSQNPWALTRIDGISFQQADEVATRLGLSLDSPDRICGLIVAITKTHRTMGHLYLTAPQVLGEVQGVMQGVDAKAFGAALVRCHKEQTIVIDRSIVPGMMAIYDPWSYHLESESASRLVSRLSTAGFGDGGLPITPYLQQLAKFGPATDFASKDKDATLLSVSQVAIDEWGMSNQLALSDNQKLGTLRALMEPISILTGLPGTGKTTSLKAVVNILQDAGVKFLLCAPTGIAAKNLSLRTGAPASTIHRAFSCKGSSDEKRESSYLGVLGGSDEKSSGTERDESWGYGEGCPFPADVVIVDEASMLDQHLLFRLLDCTSAQTRLVIVGDAAQLPSVGPGNVLRDMIRSGMFPVTDLREIFRQNDTSAIVYAAHDIHRGAPPECEPPSDFSLFQTADEDRVLTFILTLAKKLYAKRENFQILSPRHAGTVGVTNLNIKLRDLLNPPKPGLQEFKIGGSDIIREDDRVMIVQNNYQLGVYNGDVGKVSRIDQRAREIEVKIFGDPIFQVCLPYKDAPQMLRLAYACTVHKAQGLEYSVIVMPLVDGFRHQLQRNLLYTAVTRAKKKVFLVGTHSALRIAVMNDREDLRNTLLRERLQSLILQSGGQ